MNTDATNGAEQGRGVLVTNVVASIRRQVKQCEVVLERRFGTTWLVPEYIVPKAPQIFGNDPLNPMVVQAEKLTADVTGRRKTRGNRKARTKDGDGIIKIEHALL